MSDASLELLGEHPCFGGVQRFYRHDSPAIGLPMRFAACLPPKAQAAPVPALCYLAGLTCNEETVQSFLADPLEHHARQLR